MSAAEMNTLLVMKFAHSDTQTDGWLFRLVALAALPEHDFAHFALRHLFSGDAAHLQNGIFV